MPIGISGEIRSDVQVRFVSGVEQDGGMVLASRELPRLDQGLLGASSDGLQVFIRHFACLFLWHQFPALTAGHTHHVT